MQLTPQKQALLRLMGITGTALVAVCLLIVTVYMAGKNSVADSGKAPAKVLTASQPAPQLASRQAVKTQPPVRSLQPVLAQTIAPLVSTQAPSQELKTVQTIQTVSNESPVKSPLFASPYANQQQQLAQDQLQDIAAKSVAEDLLKQPLAEALEAMVNAPAHDPLDDDLFLNTTSLEKLNQQLIPEVRAGFNLGKSGALYAAREQFITVLRKVAVAKDAKEGTTYHMQSLANGLRALDEADDFLPHGDVVESEMDTLSISASHKTPVLRKARALAALSKNAPKNSSNIAPLALTSHQVGAEYARYAAQQLSEAVADEEAGSMAYYGLGKVFARLEAQLKDPTAGRKSNVMYRAAISAHPENYLAANELGVRLAKAGRYESAQRMLRLATNQPANATVYENLAAVEQKLGNLAFAQSVAETSRQIAVEERSRNEISRRHGVAWVSPDAFRQSGASTPALNQAAPGQPAMAGQPMAEPIAVASVPTESTWRRALSYAKKKTQWDSSTPDSSVELAPAVPSATQNSVEETRIASPQYMPWQTRPTTRR